MHTKIKTFIFLFFLTFLFACTEDIILPFDSSSPLLVVEGYMSSDTTTHTIKLSKTNNFYATEQPIPITGAIVKIIEGDEELNLTETLPGIYQTENQTFALPEKKYKLKISNVDINNNGEYEEYWAESSYIEINSIDSTSIRPFDLYPTQQPYLSLYAFFQERAETENYYMVNIYKNNILVTDTITEAPYMSDSGFNGLYIDDSFALFSIYNFNQEKEDKKLKNEDTIDISLFSIPKDYYLFLNDLSNSGNGSNPFMGPPANVRTNIFPQGKACGYFFVTGIKRGRMVYLEE